MGAAQSTDGVGEAGAQETSYGFYVLRVDEHSPAADAKLTPFFDYIISVNGVQVVHRQIPSTKLRDSLGSGESECCGRYGQESHWQTDEADGVQLQAGHLEGGHHHPQHQLGRQDAPRGQHPVLPIHRCQ